MKSYNFFHVLISPGTLHVLHMSPHITFPLCKLSFLFLQEEVPLIDFGSTGIIRCRRCRTYVNPYVTFTDSGRKWRCNICSMLNDGNFAKSQDWFINQNAIEHHCCLNMPCLMVLHFFSLCFSRLYLSTHCA